MIINDKIVNTIKEEPKIINKKEIVILLKERTKVSHAGLPRDIDFSIDDSKLKVFINNPIQNMQTNVAAFEAWILALKSCLPAEIKYVELDFELPINLSGRYGTSQICHYNRFLYRINNLLRLFPDWFFLNESKIGIVSDFINWIKAGTCLLNHSLKERISVIETDKMERQIESWFVFDGGKEPLCALWNLDEDKIFNQLPTGIFYEEISSNRSVFTRGAGAIDLWAVGKDGQSLHIIELKCGNNINMGVISEVLFYTLLIYDTCIAKDNWFTFGKYKNTADTRDAVVIKNNSNKFKSLYSHILAERYHPLFDNKVMLLIKDGLANLGISFDRAVYNYEQKVIIS